MSNESTKWLYDNLTAKGYNVGKDVAEFDSLMSNNEDSRKWAFETASKLGYNVGKDYDEFSSLVAPKGDEMVRQETISQPVTPVYSVEQQKDSVWDKYKDVGRVNPGLQPGDKATLSTFGEGFNQGVESIGQGVKYALGELKALREGGQKHYSQALSYLDNLGDDFDAKGFDLKKTLNEADYARYEQDLARWEKEKSERRLERKGMGIFDKIKSKWNDPDVPKFEDYADTTVENEQFRKPIRLFAKALEEAGGDVNKAREILAKKAGEESDGDRMMRESSEVLSTLRPTEGAAWWGQMLPQMLGQGVALGVSALPYGQIPGRIIGLTTTAGLTLSSAGQAMQEARKAGASDSEVVSAGVWQGGIELLSEEIPLERLFGKIGASSFRKGFGKLTKEAVGEGTEKEMQTLLTEANKRLGGKLLSGQTAREFIKNIGVEAASEFVAEGAGTFVPIIYETPENYPTLKLAFANAMEGAKGGAVMGAFLGGGSTILVNRANDARRKRQGGVILAEDNDGNIVEVLQEKDGMTEVMSQIGETRFINPENLKNVNSFSYDEWKNGEVEAEEGRKELSFAEGYNNPSAVVADKLALASQEAKTALGINTEESIEDYMDGRTIDEVALDDEDLKSKLENYFTAKAEDEGRRARIEQEKQKRYAEVDGSIDNTANKNDGMVYSTTLHDGREVFITGGIVVLDDEGYIDVNRSEDLVMLTPDGKRMPVQPGDLREVITAESGEDMKAARRAEIDAQIIAEFSDHIPENGNNAPQNIGSADLSIPAMQRIPKDMQGNPLYEQTDSDTAWDAIVEQTEGDVAMAQTVANGMVADKEEALKKLEKAKSKGGATIAEKIAAEKERKAAIDAAQEELNIWKKIAGTANRRKMEADAERIRVAEEAALLRKAEEERLRAEREEAERIEREALGGVPDMVDDTPQDARARGYRRVSGHKIDRQQPVQGLQGKDVAVRFSDDAIANGRVAVIEASQLQPSHVQGQRNPLHFIDEAQPKERNDEASVLSARKIAGNIRPEEITSSVTAYTGAPTVNARGEAIQGNNRSAALRLMWENNPEQAAKYKQYLIDHAEEFGLNADEVAAMQQPVLVNMLDVEDAEAITLGQYVAQDTESGGTERIKPKNALQNLFNNIYDLVQGTKQASLFEEADNTPRTLAQAIKETLNIDYNGQYDSNSLAGGNKAGQPGRQGTAGSVATGERIESGDGTADSAGGTRGNGEVSSPEILSTGEVVSPVEVNAEGGNAPGMNGVDTDNQGNPIDADGKLVVEEVASIDEITDEDFENPTRNVQLPAVPENVVTAIGTQGRPIVIKKNVFEKNGNTHVELEPEDSRNILRSALYNPNIVGSTQPIKRPDYKVAIRTGEQNAVVVLDVYQGKDVVEIVGWRMVNEKGLAKMQRQTEREGGQFLILSPNDGSAAALSALPLGLSSASEDRNSVSNLQENGQKSGEIAESTPEIQEPRSVEENLDNGDKRITNYNSRGEVATVAIERDGMVVSVDSYDEGVLFEHTEYDDQGRASLVTRYDKSGNVTGTQKYVNGIESRAFVKETMRTVPLRARAEQWMKDTGVRVRLLGVGDEITNSAAREAVKQGATGWIDNNEVVLYLPNIGSEKEIDDTFVHEVVAHKGLKVLMGKDFDALCDRVWEMMSEEQRAKYINYPGVNGDTRRAADEYMAHLAEDVDLTEQDKTVWQRIVDAVREFLVKHGFKMTDGDIENLIKASYRRLREQSTEYREQNEDGTLFRIAEVNERFNNELQQQIDGTLPKGHIYELGMPSEVLRSAGFPNLPIELAASRLSDKSMQENHPFELSEIKGLVEAVQKPLAVFRSATHVGSFVVLTEIQHEGRNYVVAIETNRKRGKIEINSVRSIHYRNSNKHIANWIEEGLLEYADKKRMSEWLSKQQYNSADVRNLFRHSAKLVESFENPNIEDDFYAREGNGPLTDREVTMESDVYSKALGKPRYTGKKQREYVARMRDRMVKTANEIAEKLNTVIEVRETTEGLTGKKAKAKGWYDTKTGKVVVVVSNHGSVQDIAATVLHEVVAHYGLRQLFGEHFDTFLDNVYNNADSEVKTGIDVLAEKHGGDIRVATEEYLAELAENTYFEKVDPSLWERIKQWFMNMLAEVDVRLGGELSDNELRYILWRSYRNLSSPGLYNPIERITDTAVRAQLGIGEYTPVTNNLAQVAEGNESEDSNIRFRMGSRVDDIRNKNVTLHKTKDGRVIRYEQLDLFNTNERTDTDIQRNTSEGNRTDDNRAGNDNLQRRDLAGGNAFAQINVPLRPLEEGETSLVQRIFTKSKSFDFTTGEQIESLEDVAYIFRNLEDESIENSFAVLVKDGKPTVIHLGMGAYTSTIINTTAVAVAMENIKPEKVYFVHNHPSGALKASANDVAILQNFRTSYGDIVEKGIIINLKSGKFGIYDIAQATSEERNSKKGNDSDIPVEIFTFNKQVFDKDFNPAELYHIGDASDVAAFVSSHRLGSRNKVGLLVCNNQLKVVGNVFTPFIGINSASAKKIAKEIVYYTTVMGGNRPVLFGRFPVLSRTAISNLEFYINSYSGGMIKLLDLVDVESSEYVLNEDEVVYRDKNIDNSSNTQEDEARFRAVKEQAQRQDADEVDMVTEAVNGLGQKLNTQITVVDDVDSLPEDRRNKKGWYDTRTGQVVVVMPNHVSAEDVMQTVLHEVVGHKGLRVVMGDKLGEFLDSVFRNLPKGTQSRINGYVLAEALNGRTMTRRMATEEYIAELAERGFEGYYNLWNGIKQWFRDFFRNFMNIEVSDGELRYMLWKNYQRLQMPSVMTTAMDVAVETLTGTGDRGVMFRSNGVVDDYNSAVKGRWNKFKQGHYDRLRSVRKAQEFIEKASGKRITDSEDVYSYAEHLPSINKNMKEVFDFTYLDPFVKLLKKLYNFSLGDNKINDKALERYANAKHGLERNREMAMKEALVNIEEKNGKRVSVFNKEGYEDWKRRKTEILKNNSLSWEEKQRELDKLARSYGAKLGDYSGISAIFDAEGKMKYDALREVAIGYVNSVEEVIGKENVKEFWEKVNGINKYSLEQSYKSGLLSKDAYDAVTMMYDFYVPLRGFTEQTAEDIYDYVAVDHAPLDGVLKRAKGRRSEAKDIFATMLNMANSAIVMGNKNKLKQMVLNLAMRHSTPLLSVDNAWYVKVGDEYIPQFPEIKEGMTDEDIAQAYADFDARMKEIGAQRHAPGLNIAEKVVDRWNEQQHAIRVKRNGKEYVVWVNGSPTFANAINGVLKDEESGLVVNVLDAVNKFRAKMVTQYSPTFVFTNLFRDLQSASGIYGVIHGFKEMAHFWRNVRDNSAMMMSLYVKYKNNKLDMNVPRERLFKEFLENGGETGYTEMFSIEEYQKMLNKMTEKLNVKNATTRAIEAVGDGVEFANRCVENLCRFSAYMTSRENGLSILKSVNDAKEVSVNFNRKGSGEAGAGLMKRLYMFYNPAVQALAQRIVLAKKYPKRMIPILATEFTAGLVMPYLFATLSALMGFYDDEEDDTFEERFDKRLGNYYNLSDYRRRSSICFPTADGVTHIPLSHEARVMFGLGELAASVMTGHEEYENISPQIVNILGQSLPLNPVEGWNMSEGLDESLVLNLTPDAIKPLMEIAVNRDFTGNTIHNRSDFNEHLPEYMRGKRGTADIYKSISEAVSGGESGFEKGWFEKNFGFIVNPSGMEHLVNEYLGGMYTAIEKGAKSVLWALGDEEYGDFRNIPIVSSFYTSLQKYEDNPEAERTRRDWENAFRYYKKEIEALDDKEKAVKNAVKQGYNNAGEVLDMMTNSGEALAIDIFNDANKVLKELYGEAEVAKTDKDFDLAEDIDKQIYAQKRLMVERMEILADDPLAGYGFLVGKEDSPYGRLETYGDLKDVQVINDCQKRLKAVIDAEKDIEDVTAKQYYRKEHESVYRLSKSLKEIETVVSKMKKLVEDDPEWMEKLREERAKAVKLIRDYNE